MRASVVTPCDDPRHLADGLATLRAQLHEDWEWVVLLCGDARWEPPVDEPRLRVARGTAPAVGAVAWREAVALGAGEVVVELGQGDVLTADCLAEVVALLAARPDVVLAYSDFARLSETGAMDPWTFDAERGWQHLPVELGELTLPRSVSLEPSPHNVAFVHYAPWRVRAYRRAAYDAVGGYDAECPVLAGEELLLRLFEAGEFAHLPACLYVERTHPARTEAERGPAAVEESVRLYWERIRRLAAAWSRRQGLAVVELPAPLGEYDAGSVGLLVADDVLHRMVASGSFLHECHRVLAHGGLLVTTTPGGPAWNEDLVRALVDAEQRDQALPGVDGARFQLSGLRSREAGRASYLDANVVAVKEGPRQGGPLLC